MGKWKRLKEAFRLSENLKEYHLGIYWHIGEGERWGTDNSISRMSRIGQGDGLWIHRESGEIGAGWIGIHHGFLAATKGSRGWVGGKQLPKKKVLLKDY